MSMSRNPGVAGRPAGRQPRKAQTLRFAINRAPLGASSNATVHGAYFHEPDTAARPAAASRVEPQRTDSSTSMLAPGLTRSLSSGAMKGLSKPRQISARSLQSSMARKSDPVRYDGLKAPDGAMTPSTVCPSPGAPSLRSFAGTPMTNNTPMASPRFRSRSLQHDRGGFDVLTGKWSPERSFTGPARTQYTDVVAGRTSLVLDEGASPQQDVRTSLQQGARTSFVLDEGASLQRDVRSRPSTSRSRPSTSRGATTSTLRSTPSTSRVAVQSSWTRSARPRTTTKGDSDVEVWDNRAVATVEANRRPQCGKYYGYAHGERITAFVREREIWPDREEHDKMLSQTISQRLPDEVEHYLFSRPRNPMNAAFTDRSVRMREGKTGRCAIIPCFDDSDDDLECFYRPANRPEKLPPAGNPSHNMPNNKAGCCISDAVPCFKAKPELRQTLSLSARATQAQRVEEEQEFRARFGVKICRAKSADAQGLKSCMLPHRGFVDDAVPAAGQFDQDFEDGVILRSDVRSRGGTPTPRRRLRKGIDFIMDPQPSDPPIPMRITSSIKGCRAPKEASADAKRITEHYNQEVFRFAEPGVARGRNTTAPDLEERAGLSTSGFDLQRRRRCPTSDLTIKGPPKRSRSMGAIMDHDATSRTFADYRADRLQHDTAFSNLCNETANHAITQRLLTVHVKESVGAMRSSVAEHLAWEN